MTTGKESLFQARPRAWHVISDLDLMALLRRAHAGEEPDLLYIEEYVNADREEHDEDR